MDVSDDLKYENKMEFCCQIIFIVVQWFVIRLGFLFLLQMLLFIDVAQHFSFVSGVFQVIIISLEVFITGCDFAQRPI